MNSIKNIGIPVSTWDRLSQAVTVATVIGFISQVFGSSTRGTALICIVALSVTGGGLYLIEKYPKAREKLYPVKITPSKIVALVLAAVLTGALLRQHSIDSKIPFDIGEISDTLQWRINFCSVKVWGNSEDCILDALKNLTTEIRAREKNPSEELFADQVLGEIVRTSDEAKEITKNRLGVYQDSFLGTGTSLPAESVFTEGRIPEYLVPNYSDDHNGVLMWTLNQTDPLLKGTLQDLLDSKASRENENGNQNAARANIKGNITSKDLPSLVRFAMVPDLERTNANQSYSGCFGLPMRRRVFFSNLNYMIRNTDSVLEAANFSGYQFTPGATNQHLYVFMLSPINHVERLEPTWRNVLLHLDDESVCKQ